MCGRIIVDYDENMDVSGDAELAGWMTGRPDGAESSWNLKPTQSMPAAFTSAKGGRKRYELAYWSLVPVWSKELRVKFPTFNARSEGLSEMASFKGPLVKQRCVIPVTGFYEWTGPEGAAGAACGLWSCEDPAVGGPVLVVARTRRSRG